jgi:hypothetical protein
MIEFVNIYNIEIMITLMILCSVAIVLGVIYNSITNNIIRGLKNQVQMRDDRIEELILECDSKLMFDNLDEV